jgi:propanediol dehydratase large subunit
VPAYDNMFGPSNFNGEDLDDYLVLQRDWGFDGALRSVGEDQLREVRERAARATQSVYRDLGLADLGDDRVAAVVDAAGSKDLDPLDPAVTLDASETIRARGVSLLNVVVSLARAGFTQEAERVLAMGRAHVTGDYLQTAAIFDYDMNVLSKITDPNDYRGPGTGYAPSQARRAEMATIRQQRSKRDLLDKQAPYAGHVRLVAVGDAERGSDPREVCIGLSPALGSELWATMAGIPVGDVIGQILAGLQEEGCAARLVQVRSTIDLGMIGLVAARLAGSGIGVGLQAKGTALIHRSDLAPLACLELYSVAPLITPEMYRDLGRNAGRHAKGLHPAPLRNPYIEEAIEPRYHAEAVTLVAIERECCVPEGGPLNVEVRR